MAHELLHSTKPLDKALSNVLLCSVGYMHWTCSHLAHHRNVSPPMSWPHVILADEGGWRNGLSVACVHLRSLKRATYWRCRPVLHIGQICELLQSMTLAEEAAMSRFCSVHSLQTRSHLAGQCELCPYASSWCDTCRWRP